MAAEEDEPQRKPGGVSLLADVSSCSPEMARSCRGGDGEGVQGHSSGRAFQGEGGRREGRRTLHEGQEVSAAIL